MTRAAAHQGLSLPTTSVEQISGPHLRGRSPTLVLDGEQREIYWRVAFRSVAEALVVAGSGS
jgi:hypothetical protein